MLPSSAARRPVRKRVYALLVAFNLVIAIVIVLIAEGVLSFFAPTHWRNLTERKHCAFDPLLGWVNLPSMRVPNLYGPGLGLTTNARGFRGEHEIDDEIPPGKMRIVCSGDSFTLGSGVDDADTYPQQLEELDRRIETVNMGQGGYGVDQAYLWYERDATFAHDITVFAVITADLRRMRGSQFFGYPKPRLLLEGGSLVPSNMPLTNIEEQSSLKIVSFLDRHLNRSQLAWAGRALLGKTQESADGVLSEDDWLCFEAILADLDKLNRQRGSTLCIVYLPSSGRDYTGDETDRPRERIRRFCRDRQIIFSDVVADWKKLPTVADAERMISPMTGHYNADGNRFAAEAIYRGLKLHCLVAPALAGHVEQADFSGRLK